MNIIIKKLQYMYNRVRNSVFIPLIISAGIVIGIILGFIITITKCCIL
jgi:hypothetical protein